MQEIESLKRAQQGDASSIAALLDQQLRPQGVTVTGLQTPTGLQLNLKGVTVEQQILLRPYLREVLHQLQIPVSTVQVQGCTAQGKLIWQTNLRLAETLTTPGQKPTSATPVAPSQTQPIVQPRRSRLVGMMALAAIAGVAVALWQINRPPSTPIAPEPGSLPTGQPQ